jgi:hypothetical protein
MCAIINKIEINDTDWQFWNVRQASTAVNIVASFGFITAELCIKIYVSNIPILVTLVRKFVNKTMTRTSKQSNDNLESGLPSGVSSNEKSYNKSITLQGSVTHEGTTKREDSLGLSDACCSNTITLV